MNWFLTILSFLLLGACGVFSFFSIKKSILEIRENLKKRKELKQKNISKK